MFPTLISNIKSIYLNYYLSAEEISLYLFDLREIRCFHSERQWRKLAYLQNCTVYNIRKTNTKLLSMFDKGYLMNYINTASNITFSELFR